MRIGRHCFYVLHDVAELQHRPASPDVDAVIYGHSHKASIKTADGVLYLNPGSAGPRRFKLAVTLATLDLDVCGPLQPVVRDLSGLVQAGIRQRSKSLELFQGRTFDGSTSHVIGAVVGDPSDQDMTAPTA